MSLETPNFESSQEKPKNLSKQERINLAKELQQRDEAFSFPGVPESIYDELREEEEDLKKLLGEDAFSTIDELIEQFQSEGMKVMLGKNPDSGNIFIAPAGSSMKDIEKNSLFPRHLRITSDMNEKLKRLIQADKNK